MVKKWFSVNEVTSLTLDEEANRQKKAGKELQKRGQNIRKTRVETPQQILMLVKQPKKNDDDSTSSFELIGEGDNQKNETFGKNEGSQLDKSVDEIVENRNLNGDTIGLYVDYLKQNGLLPQVSLANRSTHPLQESRRLTENTLETSPLKILNIL